jgi:hypothetical protein
VEWNYIERTHAFSSVLKLMSRRLCRTQAKELVKLFELQKQPLARTIADHEKDLGRMAEIFERINQARQQLVVRICVIVVIFRVSLLLPSV